MNEPAKYRRRILLRVQQLSQPSRTEQTYGRRYPSSAWGSGAAAIAMLEDATDDPAADPVSVARYSSEADRWEVVPDCAHGKESSAQAMMICSISPIK